MIVLERFCYGPVGVGTFGQLIVDAKYRCYTVEREWMNNQPFVSCLPLGEYQLEPVVSPRWGDTLALTQAAGGGVVLAACDPWLLRTDAAVAALEHTSQPLYATLLAKLFEPGTDARRAQAQRITTECFETRWRRAKACVGRHLQAA